MFLDEATQYPILDIAKGARKALVGDLETLATRDWVDELRPLVATSHLDESDKAQLVSRLKQFLVWGKHPDDTGRRPCNSALSAQHARLQALRRERDQLAGAPQATP